MASSPTTGASKSAHIEPHTQKITTFLWFDNNAEEAVNFYVSTFKNSKIRHIARYGDAVPDRKGSVMTIDFELDGQLFTALNGGPTFKFNEAISLMVHCQTQEEVDYFWEKLSEGGQQIECGWLKDKYGLAWQIVPEVFMEMIRDSDQQKVDRGMKAMMKMKKLEIKPLLEAMNG
ncbi:MAG TPA: VOC family protein [Pyrinomonadaceae bacterium]|nr:VOC family protein [Pyrinomonadaceae bacterium]